MGRVLLIQVCLEVLHVSTSSIYNTNNVLPSPSLRAQHDSADSALVALLSVYKQLSPHLVNVPVPMRLKVAHPVHCSFIILAYLILIVLCEVGVVSAD